MTSVLRDSASTSGVGVAAAPCMNTRMPLVIHETASSAPTARVVQSLMPAHCNRETAAARYCGPWSRTLRARVRASPVRRHECRDSGRSLASSTNRPRNGSAPTRSHALSRPIRTPALRPQCAKFRQSLHLRLVESASRSRRCNCPEKVRFLRIGGRGAKASHPRC